MKKRTLTLALCALVVACLLREPGRSQSSVLEDSRREIDRSRLEVVEELSESLANDLLALSVAVRDFDTERMAQFIPETLTVTPIPSSPRSLEPQVKWVSRHGWEGVDNPSGVQRLGREQFVNGWAELLGHFSEVEDARFKVKKASFDDTAGLVAGAREPTAAVGSTGQARLYFYLVGRDPEGRREWLQGTAEVSVRRAENQRWQFESFAVLSLDSFVATTDLFSEVSVPAGVDRRRPAFGTGGNTGFVWHGAAAADFNNDGWIDIFVTGPDRNYLYLNEGNGRFREVGLEWLVGGVAVLALDYDNDSDRDIFITAVGQQMLLENHLVPDGELKFVDVSVQAGVAVQAIGFSATAGDINGDGRPDIYVTAYNHYGKVKPNSWYRATNGTKNLLFVSQPDGSYREDGARWGVDDRRWSYAAQFVDVNGDGQLDLYVANDFGENALYIHHGDHFIDEAAERGVLDPGYGMGVHFGDFNNDGRLDLHVTNMSSTAGNRILGRLFPDEGSRENVFKKLAAGNSLYENLGDGYFRDVTYEVGGFSGGWAWGGGFLDFDNDGWEDLFTPNGFISGKSMKDT